MELEVVNVGQGNFNVIKIGGFNLFYDLGAPLQAKEVDVDDIVSRNCSLFNTEFGVLISHWDVDHYRLIFNLEKVGKLKNMKFLICPNHLPNMTSIKAFDIVVAKNIYIHTIYNIKNNTCFKNTTNIKVNRGDTPYSKVQFSNLALESVTDLITLCKRLSANFLYNCNKKYLRVLLGSYCYQKDLICLDLFHSVNKADRNKNSLVLVLKYQNKASINNYVVFTGDCHYSDLDKFILSTLDFPLNEVYLVVPHHGGGAGKFILDNLNLPNGKGEAIISVGHNPYGHPLLGNIMDLRKKFPNTIVFRTDKMTNNIVRAL